MAMGLQTVLCLFEAIFSMVSGCMVLMLDAFRRLGCIFTIIHCLEDGAEGPQSMGVTLTPEQMQAQMEERRQAETRRHCIAAFVVSVYLLTVGFVVATDTVASMYDGAPEAISSAGWVLGIGITCCLVDFGMMRYGIEAVPETGFDDDANSGWQKLVATLSGSAFVTMGAIVGMMSGGGYIDALLVMLFAMSISLGAADTVMKLSTAFEKRLI